MIGVSVKYFDKKEAFKRSKGGKLQYIGVIQQLFTFALVFGSGI
jgi:hypothetical protein